MNFKGSFKKPEILVPALGILSLLTVCFIICLKKYFIDDEFITFFLVTDPSLSHMLKALAGQVDVSPPAYFVLGWLWARVFGASEISLRLFSSLGMGFAFTITWMVMRRALGFWPASLGVTASFFLSLVIIEHAAQARFYGLFMAIGSLALLQYDRLTRKESDCSWKDFWSNTGIHGSLVLTHNFGLLYSGVFLLAYLLSSIHKKVFTPKVYLSVILGWVAFLPWLRSFLNQAEVGKPHTWIPVPHYREFFFSFSHGVLISVFLIMLFLTWYFITPRGEFENLKLTVRKMNPGSWSSANSLFILGVLLVILPPIPVWIISKIWLSIFLNVYMILSTLGWSILLSELVLSCIS